MPLFTNCFKRRSTNTLIKDPTHDAFDTDSTENPAMEEIQENNNVRSPCSSTIAAGSVIPAPKKVLANRPIDAGQRSLRPKKAHKSIKHRTLHTMKKTANRTLTLEAAARIPDGEDPYDWHAVNVLDFYNDLSLLMGILEGELCTTKSCPCMSAGPNFKFLWADGQGSKPVSLSAAEYIEKMMVWVEEQLDNPRLFPIDGNSSNYPKNFHSCLHGIFKKMFRGYAHAYHSHFDAFVSLSAESHLNTCFKHFIIYGQTHGFLKDKDTAPLNEFIPSLLKGGGKGLLQNSLA